MIHKIRNNNGFFIGIADLSRCLVAMFICMISVDAYADSLGDISHHLFSAVEGIRDIIGLICIITGAAMIVGSFFRYLTHRRNPIEAPISSVIILFIAGVCVVVLAFIPILA